MTEMLVDSPRQWGKPLVFAEGQKRGKKPKISVRDLRPFAGGSGSWTVQKTEKGYAVITAWPDHYEVTLVKGSLPENLKDVMVGTFSYPCFGQEDALALLPAAVAEAGLYRLNTSQKMQYDTPNGQIIVDPMGVYFQVAFLA